MVSKQTSETTHRIRVTLRVVVFFAFWLPVFTSEAAACFCEGGGAPCEDYWKASVVFAGVVTGSSQVTLDEENRKYSRRLINFRMDQAYRGITGTETQIITGFGDSDCGYGFKLGEKYLVYASRDKDNKLHTGTCSRTRPLSEAEDDLAYILGLSMAPPGSIIFGEVNRLDRKPSEPRFRPVAGAQIFIEGQSKRIEVITDSEGQYRVSGLAPGAYKVKLNPPAGLSIYNPVREASVSDRGCAQVSFSVETDTRITGHVFDPQGQPIADVLMELVSTPLYSNGSYHQFVRTDDEGWYQMKLVKPGRYLLGVRIYGSAGSTYVPYPRTYYPGVNDESRATVITIAEGQTLNEVDLQLPARLNEQKLEGVVTWPDSHPIMGATVWLKETEYPNNDMPYRVTTDEKGLFSFKVYEGMKYSLNAIFDSETKGKQRRSETLEVRPSGNPGIVRLTIPRSDSP